MKTVRTLMCAVLVLGLVGYVAAADMVISHTAAEYAATGIDGHQGGGAHLEGGGYVFDNTGTPGIVTITPGVTGTQVLQANWFWHPAHSSNVQYIVNHVGGQTVVTVDQKLTAAQNVLGLPGTNTGSGWYTLGMFELDASSTVVVKDATGSNGLSFDALRVSDNSAILDIFSSHFDYAVPFGGPYSNAGIPDDAWSGMSKKVSDGAAFTVTPGVAGEYELSSSWQVHSGHAGSVQYQVDLDGIAGNGDEVSGWGNQQVLADNTAGANGDWSGWKSLGTFTITEDTVIRVTASQNDWTYGKYLSASNFKIAAVPEPATLSLLAIGGILGICKRR